MKLQDMCPREQLAAVMQRIYQFGMSTSGGGNASMRIADGSIWITPSATDKSTLRPEDMVQVSADGEVRTAGVPSSELSFHLAVYAARPDILAIVHAHSPALVAFSLVRRVPDTRIVPHAAQLCGAVGYVPYETPGSDALGRAVAEAFASNYQAVIMENHGTVVAGTTLGEAFMRFETLEFCARTHIEAAPFSTPRPLSQKDRALFDQANEPLEEYHPTSLALGEPEARAALLDAVHRAYRQRLIISTYGTFSVRVGEDRFLITPYGQDRHTLERSDLVLIERGRRPAGSVPSRSVRLHRRIYRDHPEIGAIIGAQSPAATAYAVTATPIETRTIPESYIRLRNIPLIPYGDQFGEGQTISQAISPRTPIVLLVNDALLVTGASLAQTFDRFEVLEFSAQALNRSRALGTIVPLDESAIRNLEKTHFG